MALPVLNLQEPWPPSLNPCYLQITKLQSCLMPLKSMTKHWIFLLLDFNSLVSIICFFPFAVSSNFWLIWMNSFIHSYRSCLAQRNKYNLGTWTDSVMVFLPHFLFASKFSNSSQGKIFQSSLFVPVKSKKKSKFSSSSIITFIHSNKELILDFEKQIYSAILYKYLYIYTNIQPYFSGPTISLYGHLLIYSLWGKWTLIPPSQVGTGPKGDRKVLVWWGLTCLVFLNS